jgi:hypothetical protein
MLCYYIHKVKRMLELALPTDTLLRATLKSCQWCRDHFRSGSEANGWWDSGRLRGDGRQPLRFELSESFAHLEADWPRAVNATSINSIGAGSDTNESAMSGPALRVRTLQLVPKLLAAYNRPTLKTAATATAAHSAADKPSAQAAAADSADSAKAAELAAASASQEEEFDATVAELLALVAVRASVEQCIVLTFADNKWLDMLLNWMVNLHEVRRLDGCLARGRGVFGYGLSCFGNEEWVARLHVQNHKRGDGVGRPKGARTRRTKPSCHLHAPIS